MRCCWPIRRGTGIFSAVWPRAATSISVRRCWPCGSVIRRSLWRPPFPVPLRRTPGRRRSGIATGNWLPGAIWRPWSPTPILPPVCSGGTATWWITPCCSSPPLTAPPAGPATRWNTPCGGESRSLMCRFPRNRCKMKLLYCIDARRGSSSERAWMV